MDNQTHAITVVIADEDVNARRNLSRALALEARCCAIHEAADSAHASRLSEQLNAHIVLLDLKLARQFEFQSIDRSKPRSRVIVTIAKLDGQQIIEALQIGASGVVLKSSSSQVLLQSIRSTLAGHLWLERPVAATLSQTVRALPARRNRTGRSGAYGLTSRELDIIAKIAGGRTNKEVSLDCAMSERTVKYHLTNIFGKIGVSTRLELALFALNHDLVSKTPSPERSAQGG